MGRSEGRAWFGRDAAGYETGRLGYSSAIYSGIAARIGGIAGRSVFEIGPGTGLATRELLARGAARVLAVEPDAELAKQLPTFVGHQDWLEVIYAAFEDADLGTNRFDWARVIESNRLYPCRATR